MSLLALLTGVWVRITYRSRNISRTESPKAHPSLDGGSQELETWKEVHSLQGAWLVSLPAAQLVGECLSASTCLQKAGHSESDPFDGLPGAF